MMEVVLITHLKRSFDIKLAEAFAREGYRVYAVGNLAVGKIADSNKGRRPIRVTGSNDTVIL